MNIAICEDQINQANLIRHYIDQWSKESNIKVNISYYKSGECFLFNWKNYNQYDLIFLDIEIGNTSGIELSRIIRKHNEVVSIVFVTANPKYVFYGYDVNALQYLVKPISKVKLIKCLNNVYENRINRDTYKDIIIVESTDGLIKIDTSSILYCIAFYPILHIETVTKKIEVKMRMIDIENILAGKGFVKPHRSYLVNLKHISSLHKNYLEIDNGEKVPISRLKVKEISDQFIEYFTGEDS